MSSVTFDVAVGGDGSTVTDDNNATTGLREGGWKTRFVPCFTQQVAVANYIVTKAGEASTSAAAAAASASAAAASYDSFDDRYLGAKSSDPSVDNDGNTLLTGAIYWNSAGSIMKVWSGTAWVAYNPAISYLPLSGGTMTGAITFAEGQTFPTLNQNTTGYASKLKSATTVIDVSAATAPTAGQVLTAVDSTHAIWEDVPEPPPSAGTITAVASGSLANGDVVYLNSDGTVSVESASSIGTPANLNAGSSTTNQCATYDSVNNKVVVAYGDPFGVAVVGTVSGNSITFGTKVQFTSYSIYAETIHKGGLSITFDTVNAKVVIAYGVNEIAKSFAIHGTVSGTSISFGTPFELYSGHYCKYMTTAYDSIYGRIGVAFSRDAASQSGIFRLLRIEGTSFVQEAGDQFSTAGTQVYACSMVFSVAASSFVVFYTNPSNVLNYAVLFTPYPGYIQYGTPTTITGYEVYHTYAGISAEYCSVSGYICVTTTKGSATGFRALCGVVAGYGFNILSSAISRVTDDIQYITSSYNPLYDCVVIIYRLPTNTYPYYVIASFVDGNVSLSTPVSFASTDFRYFGSCYDSTNNKTVFVYRNWSSNAGNGNVLTLANQQPIGISTAAYTNGQTATIGVVGYNATNQSDLIAGKKYYLNTATGAKQTVPTNAYLGTALSTTSLLVKG